MPVSVHVDIEDEAPASQAPQQRETGRSFPLGASVTSAGVNFSMCSRQASGVDLQRLRLLGMNSQKTFALSRNQLLRRGEIDWHGVRLGRPD